MDHARRALSPVRAAGGEAVVFDLLLETGEVLEAARAETKHLAPTAVAPVRAAHSCARFNDQVETGAVLEAARARATVHEAPAAVAAITPSLRHAFAFRRLPLLQLVER